MADELTVNLGLDILQIVPGRVSTEVRCSRGPPLCKATRSHTRTHAALEGSCIPGGRASVCKRACVCVCLRAVPQVDAHLSFNTQATYDKALRLMDLYVKKGVDPK